MDETFTGKVRQIRLSPTTIQNVVNYIVVVDAANDKKLLLPGMTATVDFLVEERKDVLMVPNAALSFSPPQDMLQKLQAQMAAKWQERQKEGKGGDKPGGVEGNPGATQSGGGMNGMSGGRTGGGGGGNGNGNGFLNGKLPEHMGRVFYLDEKGNLAMAFLQKGITDGKLTEILHSRTLTEGMKVITTFMSGEKAQKK